MLSKKCLTRVSSKSVKQECLIRALRNSVKQGCPTKVSPQCVNSGCLTTELVGNVTNKYCLCLSTYVSAFGFVGFISFFACATLVEKCSRLLSTTWFFNYENLVAQHEGPSDSYTTRELYFEINRRGLMTFEGFWWYFWNWCWWCRCLRVSLEFLEYLWRYSVVHFLCNSLCHFTGIRYTVMY